MPQQVAAEQAARLDAIGLEVRRKVAPGESGVLADRDHEAEPRRICLRRRDGQDEPVFVRAQRLEEAGMVALARRDELVEACQLG